MKGSTFDALIIVLTIFALGIILMLCDTVLTSIDTAVKAAPNMSTTDASGNTVTYPIVNTTHLEKGQAAILHYDELMPFILIGLIAIAVVMAFFIPTHPVMFIPSMFTLILVVIISAQLTNAYGTIASTPAIQASANKFTITANIISNLPLIATLIGAIIMIAMFIVYKRPSESVAG